MSDHIDLRTSEGQAWIVAIWFVEAPILLRLCSTTEEDLLVESICKKYEALEES